MADTFTSTDSGSGVTQNTAHLWSYFHRETLEFVKKSAEFAQVGDQAPLPQKFGKTVYWTKIRRLPTVTSTGTDGISPDLRAVTSAQITGSVSTYKDAIGFTRTWVGTNVNNGIEKILRELVMEQLVESVDLITRNALQSAIGTTQYGGSRTALSDLTSSDGLTLSVARNAKRTLEANNVRPHKSGAYPFIGHTNTLYDMKTDTSTGGWIDCFKYSDVGAKKLFNSESGMVDDIRFIKSNNVSSTSSGTSGGAYAYTNMIFGYQPFGVVKLDGFSFQLHYQPFGSAGTADPTKEKASLGWVIWYTTVYFGGDTTANDPDRGIMVITGRTG